MTNHERRVFHLPDLLEIARPGDFVIANHSFDGCDFHGPAIFAFVGGVEFAGNRLNGGPEGVLWEIPPERNNLVGAFGLQDSAFRGCTFTNIGIAGKPDVIAQFKAKLLP